MKLQNALVETAEIDRERNRGREKRDGQKKEERKRGRERERRDFIAGINGNNITRFRFRQLFTLKGIVFH